MLSLRSLRAVKSAIGLVLCASLLVAQQPPAAAPTPPPEVVFSVTTTLVQVDAVVTDSKGHYVTGLTEGGFAVYDDGKPQKITNFSSIRRKTLHQTRQGKPEPRTQHPRAARLRPVLPILRADQEQAFRGRSGAGFARTPGR
jgi:hypothetical protein